MLTKLILLALSVVGICAVINYIDNALRLRRIYKKAAKQLPQVKVVNESKCDLHEWSPMDFTIAMIGIEPKEYKVCVKCGHLGGTNYVLNKAGLESALEKIEIMKAAEVKRQEDINRIKHSLSKFLNKMMQEHDMYSSESVVSYHEKLVDYILSDDFL